MGLPERYSSGSEISWLGENNMWVYGRSSQIGQMSYSGVPQGSVLGPILLVLYVNVLPDIVESQVKLFADDTKLYSRVQKGDPEGNGTIQKDLTNLEYRSDTRLLRFNAAKCKCMHLGNPEITYTLEGVEIATATEEKELGVYLTNDCKHSLQCTKSAAKAMSSLRVIRRTLKHIDKESFRILYKAYMRPHIEYCVQAWSPYQVNDIKTTEKIQRSATKMVYSLRNKPYLVRLKELKLYHLEIRRLRGNLIEVFKILNGLVEIKPEHLFQMSHNVQTRSHRFKLFKKPLNEGLNLTIQNTSSHRGWWIHRMTSQTAWWMSRQLTILRTESMITGRIMDMGCWKAYNLFYTHQS